MVEKNTLRRRSSKTSKDCIVRMVFGGIWFGCMEIGFESHSTCHCSHPTLFHIDSVLSIDLEISTGDRIDFRIANSTQV
jgi:hypothetical protein